MAKLNTTFKVGSSTVELFFNKFEEKKKIGFASVSIKKDGEFVKAYNSLTVIKSGDKNDSIFIAEPKRSKEIDGEWKDFPYYILDKPFKKLITDEIIKLVSK